MKGKTGRRRTPTALLFFAGFPGGGLFAHGVEVYDISGGPGALAAHFKYSPGEGMAYAQIRLFAPSRSGTEVLLSLTDRNGRFSFVPDGEGPWIVKASDGMGRQGSITVIAVGGAAEGEGMGPPPSAAAGGERAPLGLRLLLGPSLILHIFALHYLGLRSISKNGLQSGGKTHAYQ